MDCSLPIQRSHPAAEPLAKWYRLALLLTGDAAAAGGVLREVFALAAHELAQLRSKERQRVWMIGQIRSRALKGRQTTPATASSGFVGQVAALPEPSRSLFALFHCLEGTLEELAEAQGLNRPACAQALACARLQLAPGAAFPESALLQLHRPWGGDTPKVASAVRDAQADPQLAAQIAADLQWHEEIHRIEVPEELALLHLAKPPKMDFASLLFQPAVLAIALALLVVVGVCVHLAKRQMDDFPGKESVAALVEETGSKLGSAIEAIRPTEAGKLGDWFVLKGFEAYAVPHELQKAKAIGCRVFKWEGVQMAEVALEKQNARLVVFRSAEWKNGLEQADRHIFQQDEYAVAAWNEQENGYVLMFKGDFSDLPGFLQTAGGN